MDERYRSRLSVLSANEELPFTRTIPPQTNVPARFGMTTSFPDADGRTGKQSPNHVSPLNLIPSVSATLLQVTALSILFLPVKPKGDAPNCPDRKRNGLPETWC